MLISRNAGSTVFCCYLMIEGKKQKTTATKNPNNTTKQHCPFPVPGKLFIKPLQSLWSTACVLGSDVNLQTRACSSFLGSPSCKGAWLICCSYVTSIYNFKSFLLWVLFAFSFVLFPCLLASLLLYVLHRVMLREKKIRHVVWLKVFIFSCSLFLWNAEGNNSYYKPQLFCWK